MTGAPVVRVLIGELATPLRARLAHVLDGARDFLVVGETGPADDIVPLIRRLRPNLILIGVRGGVQDPFETTKTVMAEAPTPLVLLDDNHNPGDVRSSVLALRSGALAVVPTPTPAQTAAGEGRRFLATLRALSEVKLVRRRGVRAVEASPAAPVAPAAPTATASTPATRAVAIAASTGGPAALQRILTELPADFAMPILVVQHIALGFIDGLAQWLNTVSSLAVKIAVEREPLRPRTVYLAPDGHHLGVSTRGAIRLSDAPPVNGFRPAADHLFESAARGFGSGLTAVVLTGMGQDGVVGLRAVRQRGGDVIAQDEGSCVVYGMPKAAWDAGLVDEVVPLSGIAGRLIARAETVARGRP